MRSSIFINHLYESEFDGSFHACQVGDRLGAGLPEEGDASHCAGFQRISTKDMKLIAGALHGRGHDRLVLFWVAFRQSGTKAGLLFCRCGSGGLLGQGQIIAIVFFPGPGWASFWSDPQLLGLRASQVDICDFSF